MQVNLKNLEKLEVNIDNPHSREPWIVASKIKNYRKAMQYLGHVNQQQFCISSNVNGIGAALQAGEYVDLSQEIGFCNVVKPYLAKLLSIQEEIWESLAKEDVIRQIDIIDFAWINPESINFIIK